MTCRTGCPTQDHASFAECARSISVMGLGESGRKNRAWDNELSDYREARRQGIQPASTRRAGIDEALRLSSIVDRPFNAADGSFA
jgi:hypothetical protein